jgi:hypothetical protein
VQLLIDGGATATATELLHEAVEAGERATIHCLLRAGAGETWLEATARTGDRVSELLVGGSELPDHFTGVAFLSDIGWIIEREVEQIESQNIDGFLKLNRRVLVYREFVVQSHQEIKKRIAWLIEEGVPKDNPELVIRVKQLSEKVEERALAARRAQFAARERVKSVDAFNALERWSGVTARREAAIWGVIHQIGQFSAESVEKLEEAEAELRVCDACTCASSVIDARFAARVLSLQPDSDPRIGGLRTSLSNIAPSSSA